MSQLSDCHTIADLRTLAQQKLPSVMFDYIHGGAEEELTLRWNREAYAKWEFVPRVLRNVERVDLSTTVQSVNLDIPIIAAPTGMSRMFHYLGEKAVVKAAHAAGSAYSLSTVSTTSIEDVAATSQGPKFFQIYAWHDKKMVSDFIERCKKAKYDGLMLAVDLPALGKRERDLRNGHGRPGVLRRNTALAALSKPQWLYRYLTSPKWVMANMTQHLPHGAEALKVIEEINAQFDATVDWQRAEAMMAQWGGKFMLKGIQSVEDAVMTADMGASGIIISNHGGRQLDGSPSTLSLLPEIVAAVGHRTEVLLDGGIERGSDVVKALALGAKGVLMGKAYLYGLAAGGEEGVARSYAILRDEMERVMRLIGVSSLQELNASHVRKVE